MAAKNTVRLANTNNAAKDDSFSVLASDWTSDGGSLSGSLSVLENDPGSARLFAVHDEQPAGNGMVIASDDATLTVEQEGTEYTVELTVKPDGTIGVEVSDFDLAEGEILPITFFYTAQMGKNGVLSTAEVTLELAGTGDGGGDPVPPPDPGEVPAEEISNGGFEAGFDSWMTLGSTTTTGFSNVGGSDVSVQPDGGSFFAGLATDGMEFGGTPATDSEIETFLGLASGDLDDLISPGNAVEGSAIKTTLTLNAGDTLSFDFRFDTQDSFVNDFAFFSFVFENPAILPAGSDKLSDIMTVGGGGDSGWQSYSFVAPESGEYTIGVGVVDELDGTGWSFLFVDNFAIA